ncbi:MAG: hypothetical protein JXA33_13095 [Anaerolineae bacterium]|nr:hypothetical protein [Anaerolineae bacterium]
MKERETVDSRSVAYKMATLARTREDPAEAYLCTWAAFRAITTTLAVQDGVSPRFSLRPNGTLHTHKVGKFKLALITPYPEHTYLDHTFKHFSPKLQHQLITHDNTRFFVTRTPTWKGTPIARDAYRQQLNGVIDAELTVDTRYPTWTPIDIALYKQYTRATAANKPPDPETQATLARQILNMLTAIQHNLYHNDTQPNDENSPDVLNKALPLLTLIVESFLAHNDHE